MCRGHVALIRDGTDRWIGRLTQRNKKPVKDWYICIRTVLQLL